MRRVWLVAALFPWLVACATTRALSPDAACAEGSAFACNQWGGQLLQSGDRGGADGAFGKACEAGDLDACLSLGELRLAAGDLDGAQLPLWKVYTAGREDGALALADLREARGGADDLRAAEQLRWEAPALDKPAFEFLFAYRVDAGNGVGTEVSMNIQPMAFMARRLTFGAGTVFGPRPTELNGFVGYQHFLSSWLVPYGRLLVGRVWEGRRSSFNAGAEAGVKLCWGPIGHLNLAMGSSLGSSAYASVGLGLDGIITLYIAAHALR